MTIAPKTVLLTSFTTWEAHQPSNSSDDLLHAVMQADPHPNWHFVRQMPVDFEHAPKTLLTHFSQIQPDVMVCCGMAANRTTLNVESQAIAPDRTLKTRLNLEQLIHGLRITEISHDAGRFVCNALYFAALDHLHTHHPDRHCVFVHVPILTADNTPALMHDFRTLLHRLTGLT